MKTAWIIEAGEPNARPRLYRNRYWVAQFGDSFIGSSTLDENGTATLVRIPDMAHDFGSEAAAQHALDHYRHKAPMAELIKTSAVEGPLSKRAVDLRVGDVIYVPDFWVEKDEWNPESPDYMVPIVWAGSTKGVPKNGTARVTSVTFLGPAKNQGYIRTMNVIQVVLDDGRTFKTLHANKVWYVA